MLMTEKKASHKSKPTVLDIFCGAGGMSLGFKNAGCQILGGIDNNRYAVETKVAASRYQKYPGSQ
jgi:DNA (cytosine-5)-methyltransferase 1